MTGRDGTSRSNTHRGWRLATFAKHWIVSALPSRRSVAILAMLAAGLAHLPVAARAQSGTDIHLARIELTQPVPRVQHLVNASNRAGYDNQPMFDRMGRALYFTSIDSSAQADIYRFDIDAHAMHHLTRTKESEFSPTFMPDGRALSVVRVDLQGEQRLWRVGLDGAPLEPLLDITRVGYHVWVEPDLAALFLVGDRETEAPHILAFANLETGHVDTVLTSPGRCLRALSGTGVVTTQFVAVSAGATNGATGESWIVCVDTEGEVHRLLPAIPGGEDFEILPDGRVLMTTGSKLYVTNESIVDLPNLPEELRPTLRWRPCLDVARFIPGPLSRVAVSPDGRWLAVVAAEVAAPPDSSGN